METIWGGCEPHGDGQLRGKSAIGVESARSGMAYRKAEQRSLSFSVGWGKGRLRQSRRGLLRIRLWTHGL